jgi:phosphohistidine phosphatase
MAQLRPDYFYTQSAVIPYREREGGPQVLLITSRKKRRWVIPKGVKEPDLTPQASAAKEALEEAGIEGCISERPIGSYRYRKWGGICTVQVFVMAVARERETWEEPYRDREWVSLETAISRIDEDRLKDLLRSLPGFLRGAE